MCLIVVMVSCCVALRAYTQPQKVIIDCDAGVDDAMELVFALQLPQLDIIGITTVAGNAHVEQCTKNTLRVVELAGKEIPVFQGSEKSLVVPAVAPPDFVHGKDGLGNTNQPEPKISVQKKAAAQFIADITRANPGEITILALGKLTNLAEAIQLDSNITNRIKEVVIAGGAFRVPGLVTPVAEPNIWGDPHAADIVFTAPWKVTMFPLDVSMKMTLSEELLLRIKNKNQRYGEFVYSITRLTRNFQMKALGLDAIYDPGIAGIAYLIDSNLFKFKQGPVRVVTDGIARGQTIMPVYDFQMQLDPSTWQGKPLVTVAFEIDRKRILEYYEAIME